MFVQYMEEMIVSKSFSCLQDPSTSFLDALAVCSLCIRLRYIERTFRITANFAVRAEPLTDMIEAATRFPPTAVKKVIAERIWQW